MFQYDSDQVSVLFLVFGIPTCSLCIQGSLKFARKPNGKAPNPFKEAATGLSSQLFVCFELSAEFDEIMLVDVVYPQVSPAAAEPKSASVPITEPKIVASDLAISASPSPSGFSPFNRSNSSAKATPTEKVIHIYI